MIIDKDDTMISALWDRLAPRERIVRFHLGNTLRVYKSWAELSNLDTAQILTIGRTLGFDYTRPLDPSAFAGAIKPKVETHH